MDVVGLGLATLDLVFRLERMPTWEQGQSLSGFGIWGGGPVATAIVAAARLGLSAGFVGTAGDDLAGRLKRSSLEEEGVDTSRLVIRPGPEGQVILVQVQESTGERVFSALDRIRANQLRPEELDRQYITSAQFLHLDGNHLEAAQQAASWMREAGRTVVLDAGKTRAGAPPRVRALLRNVDVLICGAGFTQGLTGEAELERACREALKAGPRIVVETLGEKGCVSAQRDEVFHTPAFDVPVLDTTGAGDVFHGAYIVALFHGWDTRRAALFASAAAAMKCGSLGGRAGIPSFDAVVGFLRDRGTDIRKGGS